MGSLDVDTRFTNIPLDETINICISKFFQNTNTVEGFTKSDLKQLLCLATKESCFIFIGLLYKQIDGVAIGSPLLIHFCHTMKKNWLNSCLQGFKPVSYLRYVDDIFRLFNFYNPVKHFQDFQNSCHVNMSLSMETEKREQIVLSRH